MKKTTLFISVLLCISLIVSLAACGNKSNTENPASASTTTESTPAPTASPETKKDPVTLTFSTFNAWWNMGNMTKAIELYETETGNKIDPQIFPDDQFRNVIMTKLASGDTPDFFAIWPSISIFNLEQLEPLDGPWTSKIDPVRAKNKQYAKDGVFYTAPYGSCGIQGIMYNKDVLKQAGVTPPFKTYNEFLVACEALKKTGVIPLYLPNKEGWTTQLVFYVGGAYISNQDPAFGANIASNKVKPSEIPAFVDLFKRVGAIKDKGYTNEDSASATMAMAEQALAEGKAAMVFGGGWLYSDFVQNYADKVGTIGMTTVNWGDNAADLGITKGGSGNGLFVPVASKQKAKAKEFVNYVMSDKVMQAMYEVAPGVNELGIDTKASNWDIEMNGYVASGVANTNANFIDAISSAFPGSGFDRGDFSAACQAYWLGKDLTKTLDDWYTEYAKINKAKGLSGF